MIEINYDKCDYSDGKCHASMDESCYDCVDSCPTGALKRKEKITFYPELCNDCGECIGTCPYHAIKMKNQ